MPQKTNVPDDERTGSLPRDADEELEMADDDEDFEDDEELDDDGGMEDFDVEEE